ncbi:MAG: 50S ribosomal protein L5 [Phycisphaerales bacterium]
MAKDTDNKPQNEAKPEGKPEGGSKGKGPEGKGKKGAPAPKRHSGKHVSAEAMAAAEAPATEAPRLKKMYDDQVRAKLASEKGLKNPMSQPRLDKIVINVNMGRHLEGSKIPPHVRQTIVDTITTISGQKPVVVKARKSVSNFKLRAGFEASVMVTMRRERMWNFLDRMINLAAPRIKDFRGLPTKAFDAQGNYSFGLTEQGVFPEINMADVTFTHGMHINFVFSNSKPELSRFVLEQLGMPFAKPEEARTR